MTSLEGGMILINCKIYNYWRSKENSRHNLVGWEKHVMGITGNQDREHTVQTGLGACCSAGI